MLFDKLKQFFTLNKSLKTTLESDAFRHYLMNNALHHDAKNSVSWMEKFSITYLGNTISIWSQYYDSLEHETTAEISFERYGYMIEQ